MNVTSLFSCTTKPNIILGPWPPPPPPKNFFKMSSNVNDPSDPKWATLFVSFLSISIKRVGDRRKSASGVVDNTTQINASPSSKGKAKAKDPKDQDMEEDDDEEEEEEEMGSDDEASEVRMAQRRVILSITLLNSSSFFPGWRWLWRNRPKCNRDAR